MDELHPSGKPFGTGWGMSSNVLITVTGPLMLVAIVELLMESKFCDGKLAESFALQLKFGAVDIVGAPNAVLEAPEDVEVRGDPRAACSPSKLRTESSHRDVTDCILVNIYGMRNGRVTRDGHCVSEHGSPPVTRAHPPDQYTTYKEKRETVDRKNVSR